MDMNILKYMAFIKAVEYGSFTRAAEVLNYSQSGVSRRAGSTIRVSMAAAAPRVIVAPGWKEPLPSDPMQIPAR